MDKSIHFLGKIAMVTGGSSGIGLATARLLSASGAHVWLVARDNARLERALMATQAAGVNPEQRFGIYSADVADPEQVNQAVEHLIEQIGLPDVIVNSAGVTHPGYCQELDLDIFRLMMDVNYFGTVYITKSALPGMIARGSGQIVIISSMAGLIAPFGYSAYCGSKFALRGFSDALRSELKPHGVEVSIVFPPDTDTPQLAYEEKLKPPETRALSSLGGKLHPEAVARAIVEGLIHHRYLILPSWEARLFYWLSGLTGPLQYKVIDLLIARARGRKNSEGGIRHGYL